MIMGTGRNLKQFIQKIISGILIISGTAIVSAQKRDIQINEIPKPVVIVLNKYLKTLASSSDLDVCAKKIVPVFAGHLLSQSGNKVADDVLQFSLKKDHQNVKFYKYPAVITRVQLEKNGYDGFGPTLVEGDIYKIWIAKKDGVAGLPAPIPVIVPKKKPANPKIISTIGSL
jgi:hypothetical protein